MTRYRSLVLVLIVALPVASAAGCGGGEETSQTEEGLRELQRLLQRYGSKPCA